MPCSIISLILFASMSSMLISNTVAGHDRCVDIESLLQTSMQFIKLDGPAIQHNLSSHVRAVPGHWRDEENFSKAALPARSMFWEASATIEMETASESDADPASLFMPGTPAQNIKTIVFFCSISAAVLAYLRFGLTFHKQTDEELLRKCQLLEELTHVDHGETGNSTRHKVTCDKDAKSDADTELAVDAGESHTDSTDAYTDPDGGTDADTDTEADMYDGHHSHSDVGETLQAR